MSTFFSHFLKIILKRNHLFSLGTCNSNYGIAKISLGTGNDHLCLRIAQNKYIISWFLRIDNKCEEEFNKRLEA
jgi:hypothetical protein